MLIQTTKIFIEPKKKDFHGTQEKRTELFPTKKEEITPDTLGETLSNPKKRDITQWREFV